jgi:hypothetical protein
MFPHKPTIQTEQINPQRGSLPDRVLLLKNSAYRHDSAITGTRREIQRPYDWRESVG